MDGLPFAAKICDVNSPDGIDNGCVLKLFLYAEDGDQEIAVYERGWSIYPTGEHEASAHGNNIRWWLFQICEI